MKDNLVITGGSGLLALNWAQTFRELYNINLVLNKRNICMAGTSVSNFSLDSISELKNNLENLKPSLVIHTAGLTDIEKCEANPELAQQINVNLAENIAKVCADCKIQLVHISTDHLFSGNIINVEEDHPVSPQNVYAKTKAEAEKRVLNKYPESLVVRTNFYGVGASYRNSFSDMVINALEHNETVTLFDDVYYTPIYTGKLAYTVNDLVQIKAAGIYNVVGDERLSKYEFGLIIADKFNFDKSLIIKGSFKNQPNLINRPSDMSLSNKKVCEILDRKIGDVSEHVDLLHQQYISGLAAEIQKI